MIIISLALTLATTSCLRQSQAQIIPPSYPTMKTIKISGDCACDDQLDDIAYNMLMLQIYIDQLRAAPCFVR